MSLSLQGKMFALAVSLRGATSWGTQLSNEQAAFTDEPLEDFGKNIRPQLVQHCNECHGPDADPPEGRLSLEMRAATLTGGDTGPAIDHCDPQVELTG